jgi:predicted amidophosphoribosyltransferase
MTGPGNEVTCPKCGEVQSSDHLLCARCGASLETKEQRRHRLADVEQSRREAERNDVSIQRFPGFGTNGTPIAKWGTREFFAQMSNQMRRRYFVVVVFLALCFVFLLSR